MHDIAAYDIIDTLGLSYILARYLCLFNGFIVGIDRFYLLLNFSIEFISSTVKKLDTIVIKRIVTCRDHNAGITTHIFCQKGDSRCRHRADLYDIVAHGGESRDDGIFYHIAASSGVLADQYLVCLGERTKVNPCGHGQSHACHRADFFSCLSPYPVCSE